MSNYSYVAVDPQGIESRGTLDVSDQSEALRRIKEMGLFPTKVLAARPTRPSSRLRRDPGCRQRQGPGACPFLGWGSGIGPRPSTVFTRQLATLVEAGMPLLRGLRTLQEQAENRALRRIIGELSLAIENGSSFAEALALHPRIFNRLYDQHGQGRRNRRRAGCDPPAAGRLHGEGAEDQRQSQSGHVLPLRRVMCRHGHSHPAHDLCRAAIQRGVRRLARWRANAGLHHVRPAPQRGGEAATSCSALSLPPRWALPSCAPCGPAGAVGPSTVSSWRCLWWGRSSGRSRSPASAAPWGRCSSSGVPILQALTIVKETAGNVVVGGGHLRRAPAASRKATPSPRP